MGTYRLFQTVQCVDDGTSFEQSFSLDETQATTGTRDQHDLTSQAELWHP